MPLKGILVHVCLLAVFQSSRQADASMKNCTSRFLEDLTSDLEVAGECGGKQDWTPEQRATLLVSLRNLTDKLHTQQLRECQGAEPVDCPEPEVPQNGGLACATVSNVRYCKPLCNHGYDFAFLRRSRVFDECSAATGYKWRSHYVGGNKLAVCHEATLQVAGSKTMYFAKGEDCLTIKQSEHTKRNVLKVVKKELNDPKHLHQFVSFSPTVMSRFSTRDLSSPKRYAELTPLATTCFLSEAVGTTRLIFAPVIVHT